MLAPDLDPADVRPHLAAIERIAAGDPAAGPIAGARPPHAPRASTGSAAPSSTIIQPSAVHTGLCDDPGRISSTGLFRELVVVG